MRSTLTATAVLLFVACALPGIACSGSSAHERLGERRDALLGVGEAGPGVDPACPNPGGRPSPSFPADLPASSTVAAGTIPGAFSVSSTGEATYTMPLVVPPGAAGVQPSLAVAYSSSAGAGFLGVGFGLQGLSAVTRCPSNVAQDGAIRAVRYDRHDRLCLDGARLVEVDAHADAGGDTREYRTFPDSFRKVVAHYPAGWDAERGAQFFEVFTTATSARGTTRPPSTPTSWSSARTPTPHRARAST